MNKKLNEARPFLKWAGGKRQILGDLAKRIPTQIVKKGVIETYIEPFVGGGAFFFYLKNNFEIKKSVLLDINNDLILTYLVIQKGPGNLIEQLKKIESNYLKLNIIDQEKFFYKKRKEFNDMMADFDFKKYNSHWVERAALVIFLNKTCFNGLFRQNSKGLFNVPFGKYKNPTICDEVNIKTTAIALKNTEILCGDFNMSIKYVSDETLIYLDPPYRPIIKSSFTKYSKDGFNDNDQRRLAQYFKDMSKKRALLMLSNSDPKSGDINDHFFDDLYKEFQINRVLSKRSINSKASKRGKISEIIITNYTTS